MSDKARGVGRVIDAQQVFDGAGVRLRRSIASRALSYHDPFLLLDEMHSDDPDDYIAGFPTHPHPGIETVTYMLHGVMHHEDSTGNGGDIGPGSVQWMTAGRGILHSEIPRQEDGLLWGFQLWVNLPAAQKMRDPRYQEVAAEKIPEVELDGGGLVRVIAGDLGGVSGAVRDIVVDPLFVDLRLPAGTSVQIPVDPEHNVCAYVYDGEAHFGDTLVPAKRLVLLEDGDTIDVAGEGVVGRLLLFAGRPLHEPVVRWGPFAMNTQEEIDQAIRDYRNGTLA